MLGALENQFYVPSHLLRILTDAIGREDYEDVVGSSTWVHLRAGPPKSLSRQSDKTRRWKGLWRIQHRRHRRIWLALPLGMRGVYRPLAVVWVAQINAWMDYAITREPLMIT